MTDKTFIEYCDSTLNLQMGCAGCELWNGRRRSCYAGRIVEKYAGAAGYPESFDQPIIFPDRIEKAKTWGDYTGKIRPIKPWLNGLPRVIFLNDMGDTFTNGLPDRWIADFIPALETTPHIYLMLTKRADRMAEFWEWYGPPPDNIWLGVSITSRDNMIRARTLAAINAKTKWLSVEPMLESLSFGSLYPSINWLVCGFESGPDYRMGSPSWFRSLRDETQSAGVPFFVKQMGGERNRHGEIRDLPADLQIRQMPDVSALHWIGKTDSGKAGPTPTQGTLFHG